MEYYKIGKIVNVVGLKGEIKVFNYSDPDRYDDIDRILIKNKNEYNEYHVKSSRNMKDMIVLKLKEVEDRTEAEKLKEKDIYVTDNDLRVLPEDTFYIKDLIGCRLIDIKGDIEVGVINSVLKTGAQDVYEVKLPDGKLIYIPAVKEFIKEINIKESIIFVDLIEGFLENAIEA